MKAADRDALLAVMMRGMKPGHTRLYKVLEEMEVELLDELEPVIDAIVRREVKAAVKKVA